MSRTILLLLTFGLLICSIECEEWITWSANRTSVPKNSVIVSNDISGSYYVIRVSKDGETSPGKFSPELQQAFISQDDQSVGSVTEFEILSGKNLKWTAAADKLQNNLILGGKTKSGETFNICRVLIGTSKVPGKLINDKCFASFAGLKVVKEKNDFDALMRIEKN